MKRGFLVKLGNLIYHGGCNEWTTAEIIRKIKQQRFDVEELRKLMYHGGCNEATTSAAMSMIRKEVKI